MLEQQAGGAQIEGQHWLEGVVEGVLCQQVQVFEDVERVLADDGLLRGRGCLALQH